MTKQEKAPRKQYHLVNLPKGSGQQEQFLAALNRYKADTGDQPTQGEFLMLLLDQWERRKEVV